MNSWTKEVRVYFPQNSQEFDIKIQQEGSNDHYFDLITRKFHRIDQPIMLTCNGSLLNIENLSSSIKDFVLMENTLNEKEHPLQGTKHSLIVLHEGPSQFRLMNQAHIQSKLQFTKQFKDQYRQLLAQVQDCQIVEIKAGVLQVFKRIYEYYQRYEKQPIETIFRLQQIPYQLKFVQLLKIGIIKYIQSLSIVYKQQEKEKKLNLSLTTAQVLTICKMVQNIQERLRNAYDYTNTFFSEPDDILRTLELPKSTAKMVSEAFKKLKDAQSSKIASIIMEIQSLLNMANNNFLDIEEALSALRQIQMRSFDTGVKEFSAIAYAFRELQKKKKSCSFPLEQSINFFLFTQQKAHIKLSQFGRKYAELISQLTLMKFYTRWSKRGMQPNLDPDTKIGLGQIGYFFSEDCKNFSAHLWSKLICRLSPESIKKCDGIEQYQSYFRLEPCRMIAKVRVTKVVWKKEQFDVAQVQGEVLQLMICN